MIMKELYAQLGISSAVYDFGKSVEDSLKERFEKFDKTAEYNQMKVIRHSIFFALVNKLRTKSRLPFLALPVDAMDGNHHPFAEHLGQP